MGVERVVQFPSGPVPTWAAVSTKLTEAGEPPVLRMIDGELALPNETPPDGWSELRVSLSGGMVTLRRDGDAVRCIVWGTADPDLVRSRDACCAALAAAGGDGVQLE
jgi:hypothetical protein